MTIETTTFLDGLQFIESPRWHDGKLWFSDMGAGRVMNVDLEGNVEHVIDVLGYPSGLGWLPDGTLLIVSMDDRRLLRFDPRGLSEAADLSSIASYILNDMVVDRRGRAYIGNFGYDFSDPSATPEFAEIVMVTPEGDSKVVADEMAFPNGMIITPDGSTLIVAESLSARLTAFDIKPSGTLANRRIWAHFDDRGFESHDINRNFPDGICLDAEGAIWVALPWGQTEVLRVLEGGEVTHQVKVETQPFAAMLGGPDLQTLFVCTAILDDEFESLPNRGCIETVRVKVPGADLT